MTTLNRVTALTAAAALAVALTACGSTTEQRAATGAVGGAVVAGPVGAAVGAAGGAVVAKANGEK